CPDSSGFFFAFRRLFPYGLSDVSRSIGQALADDAFDRIFSPLHIVYAQPDPIVVPEVELRKIPVQVLFLTVLIHALHAALEDREVALHGVGSDDVGAALREVPDVGVAHIFVGAVGHGVVAREILAQVVIVLGLIGGHPAFAVHV